MTVGITNNYNTKVRNLLALWDPSQRFFNVSDMQKPVGKIAGLEEAAPWVFKLMSHLCTSLAFALKSNIELLEEKSQGFRYLVNQIRTNTFLGKQSDHQHHIKHQVCNEESSKNDQQAQAKISCQSNDARQIKLHFTCHISRLWNQV